MLQTFKQAKEYLYSLIPQSKKKYFPGRKGLLRMKYLLQKLANPEKKFPSVHIVGTCGKSSTAYLISQISKQAGFKVGLHISPHLQTMRERLQINGKLISEKDFIKLVNQIKPVAEKMRPTKFGRPSYFEALLAATFLYFAKQRVDLAVVEAGLGGRFDGTNVLQPEIVVLTNIGLDHTEILGKTKTAILKDKMQTIKPSCKCVITGMQQKCLLVILKKHCQKQNVPLLIYGHAFFASKQKINPTCSRFTFNYPRPALNCSIPGIEQLIEHLSIKLGLPGTFQIENACLAIAASLQLFRKQGLTPGVKPIIKQALTKAFFPGRMETVKKCFPLIILDGAHNEDKIKALVKSIKKLYPGKDILVVFGVKKDKAVEKMLKCLANLGQEFIITQFGSATDLGPKLHYPARKLFQKAKRVLPEAKLYLELNCGKAIKKAQQLAENQELILITGSLYLVGEARNYFGLKTVTTYCPRQKNMIP